MIFRTIRRSSRLLPCSVVAFVLLLALLTAAATGCDRNAKSGPAPAGGTAAQVDLSIHGMQLRRLDDGSYRAVGRLSNRSAQQVLHEVTLTFTMEDVAPDGRSTVAAAAAIPMRCEVLPQGSLYFRETVSFGALPEPRGRYEWNYSVTSVNGQDVRSSENRGQTR